MFSFFKQTLGLNSTIEPHVSEPTLAKSPSVTFYKMENEPELIPLVDTDSDTENKHEEGTPSCTNQSISPEEKAIISLQQFLTSLVSLIRQTEEFVKATANDFLNIEIDPHNSNIIRLGKNFHYELALTSNQFSRSTLETETLDWLLMPIVQLKRAAANTLYLLSDQNSRSRIQFPLLLDSLDSLKKLTKKVKACTSPSVFQDILKASKLAIPTNARAQLITNIRDKQLDSKLYTHMTETLDTIDNYVLGPALAYVQLKQKDKAPARSPGAPKPPGCY